MRKLLVLFGLAILGCSENKEEPVAEALKVQSVELDGVPMSTAALVEMPLNASVTVRFSQELNSNSDFKSFVSVLNRNSESVDSDFILSDQNKTLTIKPKQNLQGFERYTIVLRRGLSSASGGALTREESYLFFTTNSNTDKFPRITDDELLDKVQAQTFKYFWDFAHPSGMIRERNTSQNTVTTGGTGFGLMAIAVGVERKFISKSEGLARVKNVVGFLEKADKYKGAFSHWYDGNTGKTQPFSAKDNGADLVETGFLMMGLLTAAEYFDDADVRNRVNAIYQNIEWNHFLNYSESLYWHWSPEFNFELQLKIQGWNEALMTYILAAGSDKYSISKENYTRGWTRNGAFVNNNLYNGIKLPLGSDYGGPLFISQYTFLGINPNGLSDDYITNYGEQCKNHTLINRAYCIQNPNKHPGYNQYSWGLTASDNPTGYSAHSPRNDLGVITPTAALGSFAFTPVESKEALEFFYYKLGDKLWSDYGFRDAYSVKDNWYAGSYIAIDQGPIIISIENHRSGLLWKNCLKSETIKKGMSKLGLTY